MNVCSLYTTCIPATFPCEQDLLEFTEKCPSLSVGEGVARDQLVQVALHLLTQHTTGTTLTPHMLTQR